MAATKIYIPVGWLEQRRPLRRTGERRTSLASPGGSWSNTAVHRAFAMITGALRHHQAMDSKGSYSSRSQGNPLSMVRELAHLYRFHLENFSDRVRMQLDEAKHVEDLVTRKAGLELSGLDVLEVGPGQYLTQLLYFSKNNRAVGIDRDVIDQRASMSTYIEMLRDNGWFRTTKTLGRKLLGIDRKYAAAIRQSLDVDKIPDVVVHRMDVREMTFPERSFDFVYSRAVLHHLDDVGRAIAEIARVMRPGGACYLTLHPYTSPTGCLDPRIYTAQRNEVEGWPHLRQAADNRLLPANAMVNRLRIGEWKKLFADLMPECEFIFARIDDDGVAQRARALHERGELTEYSLDELLTGEMAVFWKKPMP